MFTLTGHFNSFSDGAKYESSCLDTDKETRGFQDKEDNKCDNSLLRDRLCTGSVAQTDRSTWKQSLAELATPHRWGGQTGGI